MQPFPTVTQLGIIGMLDMGFLRVIRKWALRDGLPIGEIVRRTGVRRNTIKKYLRAESIKFALNNSQHAEFVCEIGVFCRH